uniref:Uncharacterized protein n=1 Tax=viral metagenome TaxID=1070528 RepID=A0A6C0DQU8_9ZZZZ
MSESNITIPSSEIIKVCLIDSLGKKKTVFVFGCDSAVNENEIFSELELVEFKHDNTQKLYPTQQIHKDDSIRIIKKKLISAIGSELVSYDEMYLFSFIETTVDSLSVYQQFTEDIEQPISKNVYGQLIMNLDNFNTVLKCNSDVEKTNYYYDDVRKCLDQKILLKIPIGQRFSNARDLLFSASPFDILTHTPPIFIPQTKNPLLSFENQLLLNYGKLHDNTIYLCLAEDVYEFASQKNIDSEYITQLYYPLLSLKGITNKDIYFSKKQELISENKKIITPRNVRLYDTIRNFYNIYYGRNNELPYSERGIQYFEITIHPNHNTVLPLDVLFKKLNATQEMPFIKYNPGTRRENIYRLYSTSVTSSGKKIPYLPKSKILQYSRQIGKSRQLSIYVLSNNGSDVFIDFNYNGDINIRSLLTASISKDELIQLIRYILNPIIEKINDFLLPTGNSLYTFEDFDDEFVEIVDLKYVMQIQLPGSLDITSNSGCLTSVFNIEDANLSKGALLQFKRVENFKKMEMIDVNITNLFNNNKNEYDVIQYLKQNYDLSQEVALNHLSEYLRSHSRVEGRFINKAIEIVENPGFPTLMRLTPHDNRLFIEISKINSIQYIDTISTYIDSFLRMIHYPDSTTFDVSKQTCRKGKKGSSKTEAEDDVSHIENVITNKNLPFVIESSKSYEELVIEADEEETGIIFDDDDDDEPDAIIFEDDDDQIEEEGEEEGQEEGEEDEETDKVPEFGTDIVFKNSKTTTNDKDEDEGEKDEDEDAIIFYSDDEDESDEEDENENENDNKNPKKIPSTLFGGVGEWLDGQPFKKNKIFYDKLVRLDPKLFLTSSSDGYTAYSRVCGTNYNIQPVILTKEEKERIDREHPGSYEHSIEYGSDPKKKHFYICPRYWCLLNNSSITEEEVKSGKCGKIIPQNAKTIPPGHYIYEFTDKKKHIDQNGNYKMFHPGFKKQSNHPDGLCIPCCFSNWDSDKQIKRRKQCLSSENAEDTDGLEDANVQNIDYVIGAHRFPIPRNRLGFLPPSVESFFDINHRTLVDKKNPALIKRNTPILIRRGVEQNNKKSFIGCIADIYSSRTVAKTAKRKNEAVSDIPSIQEMCDIIADAISIDQYIQYHNGSLVRVFQPRKTWVDIADLHKYRDSELYKTVDFNIDSQVDFFEDTVASYENFLQFLRDEDSVINHTYLWDIVTSKNPKLFIGGINLVILNIVDNDITDNMEIICPSSAYSSNLFDVNKETVILLKRDDLYEPIYLFQEKDTGKEIKKTFYKSASTKNIQHVMKIINASTNKYCAPLSSMPKLYKFKKNISADAMIDYLQDQEDLFQLGSQIMNYQGKIIGLTVKMQTEDEGLPFIYLPCYPSVKQPEIPVEYMEGNIWKDYETTRDLLLQISLKSKHTILCKPKMKVLYNQLIVGILTETNQFVQTIPPAENVYDDGLDEINDTNYILADKVLTTSKKRDPEMMNVIRNISLENQFYSAFRTTVRLALNHPSNTLIRKDFLKWIDSSRVYKDKIKAVDILLRKLLKKWVAFATIRDDVLDSFDEITNCVKNSSTKKFCLTRETGNGTLIIPQKHLISGFDNQIIYFGRMADELVRYKRIQTLMLQPRINVNIGDVDYKLKDNEMILLDSLITPEYFEDMVPFQTNAYAKSIDYYYAQPEVTQKYNLGVSIEQQLSEDVVVDLREKISLKCVKEERDIIGNAEDNMWKRIFPKNARELVLNKTKLCTFFILIQVFHQKNNFLITVENIKDTLSKIYANYLPKYKLQIEDILYKQGKRDMINRIRTNRTTLLDLIVSEEYYLTNLDIWLFAASAKLPLVLFSSSFFKNMVTGIKWQILFKNISDTPYYFIRCPIGEPEKNVPPVYNIVKPALRVSELGGNFEEMVKSADSLQNQIMIDEFFQKYVL